MYKFYDNQLLPSIVIQSKREPPGKKQISKAPKTLNTHEDEHSQKSSVPSEFEDDATHSNTSELFENWLINNENLLIGKNTQIAGYFKIKEYSHLIELQQILYLFTSRCFAIFLNFVTDPFLYGISPKCAKRFEQHNHDILPICFHRPGPLVDPKIDYSPERSNSYYFRAQLVVKVLTKIENSDILKNLLSDYVEVIFDLMYVSLKKYPCRSDVSHFVYLISFFIVTQPGRALKNLFSYHFLMGLLPDICYPEVKNFYINLLSPTNIFFQLDENLMNMIWRYCEYVGFFAELAMLTLYPGRDVVNDKFDLNFKNFDLSKVINESSKYKAKMKSRYEIFYTSKFFQEDEFHEAYLPEVDNTYTSSSKPDIDLIDEFLDNLRRSSTKRKLTSFDNDPKKFGFRRASTKNPEFKNTLAFQNQVKGPIKSTFMHSKLLNNPDDKSLTPSISKKPLNFSPRKAPAIAPKSHDRHFSQEIANNTLMQRKASVAVFSQTKNTTESPKAENQVLPNLINDTDKTRPRNNSKNGVYDNKNKNNDIQLKGLRKDVSRNTSHDNSPYGNAGKSKSNFFVMNLDNIKLYPLPPTLARSLETEIEKKSLELSVKIIKESESFAVHGAEIFFEITSDAVLSSFSASAFKFEELNFNDATMLWQAYLISYNCKAFELLLKIYFGKLFYFAKGELSTLNSCYSAAQTINSILKNITKIPSLSKSRKDVFQLCFENIPILQKSLRSLYNEGKIISRKNLGCFRFEVISTFIYLLLLDDTGELINFKALPESLYQIVQIWFFENHSNNLLQTLFIELFDRIMTRGSEYTKLSVCFRLGMVGHINDVTGRLFKNGVKVHYINVDLILLFAKKIIKIIRDTQRIGSSMDQMLAKSLLWQSSLIVYGFIKLPALKVGKLNMSSLQNSDNKYSSSQTKDNSISHDRSKGSLLTRDSLRASVAGIESLTIGQNDPQLTETSRVSATDNENLLLNSLHSKLRKLPTVLNKQNSAMIESSNKASYRGSII